MDNGPMTTLTIQQKNINKHFISENSEKEASDISNIQQEKKHTSGACKSGTEKKANLQEAWMLGFMALVASKKGCRTRELKPTEAQAMKLAYDARILMSRLSKVIEENIKLKKIPDECRSLYLRWTIEMAYVTNAPRCGPNPQNLLALLGEFLAERASITGGLFKHVKTVHGQSEDFHGTSSDGVTWVVEVKSCMRETLRFKAGKGVAEFMGHPYALLAVVCWPTSTIKFYRNSDVDNEYGYFVLKANATPLVMPHKHVGHFGLPEHETFDIAMLLHQLGCLCRKANLWVPRHDTFSTFQRAVPFYCEPLCVV